MRQPDHQNATAPNWEDGGRAEAIKESRPLPFTKPRRSNQALTPYRVARARLDASTELLTRALDLREQLQWGVLDADEAVHAVWQLKRDAIAHKRGRAAS